MAILTETRLESALQVAEQLRERVEIETAEALPGISARGVTVSAGVASCPDNGTSREELFRLVDGLLYKAKEQGKNRVYLRQRGRFDRFMLDTLARGYSRLLLVLLLPLLLSGCLKDIFGGDRNILTPEIIKVKGHTDQPKPPVKELPAQQPVSEENKGKPCPPVEEKLLPREPNPQNPECLMPVPAPQPPSQPHAGIVPAETVPPTRREATVGTPDFSYHDATLTEDIVWHGEVLVEGGVTVSPQTTLTVQSGTVVRFRGAAAALVVQGRIVASGTADRPVVFTSSFAEPAAGDWQGLVLLASDKKNLFEQCRVEGAETGLDASFAAVTLKEVRFVGCRNGARLRDTFVVMNGGGSKGCGTGLLFSDSEADIRGADFAGNRQGIFAVRTSLSLSGSGFAANSLQALAADSCRLSITGNRFADNGNGLSLTGCEGSVVANRIASNAVNGLVLVQSRVKVNANEIERNRKIGLRVDDGRGVAWGNVLAGNGEFDLYNAGSEEFRAIGNWWGDGGGAAAGQRIYGREAAGSRGRVLYLPVLAARPPALP